MGLRLMTRSEHYRKQARECLATSRACSDRKEAAALAIIAAAYFELATVPEKAEAPTGAEQGRP